LAPGKFPDSARVVREEMQGRSPHHPSPQVEAWSRKEENERLAQEIKHHLFNSEPQLEFEKLASVVEQLQLAMDHVSPTNHMLNGGHESSPTKQTQKPGGGEEDDPDGLGQNFGFSHETIHAHSWQPSGPKWFWAMKGTATLGLGFAARPDEIRRFGHLARVVR
jgi:hypothetical protein